MDGLEELRARRDAAQASGAPARPQRPSGELDFSTMSLVRADLANMDLSGADLSGCDISGSDLTGTRLVGANLTDTIMHGVDASGAEFLSATMDRANLTDATLNDAGFGRVSAVGALFFGADASGTTLTGATLTGADIRTANLSGSRLREADLEGTLFDGASLVGVDFTGSRVPGASFRNTDLAGTKFTKVTDYKDACWIGAELHNADFTGAWLLRRHAHDENYLEEFRTQSTAHEWLYQLWWVTSDCGRSLARWTAWTVVIALAYSFAYSTVDIDWGDHETAFSPVYYSVVTFTTLGYGDVLPGSVPAQAMAMSEVVFGYFSLGGMMSILSDKIARRAG